MGFKSSFIYVFRLSSALRFVMVFAILAAGVAIAGLFHRVAYVKPVLYDISPNVALPGERVTITGLGFGSGGKSSDYIQVGDNRLTSSSIALWTDERIEVVLPGNIKDGLLWVNTLGGRTQGLFLANAKAVPKSIVEGTTEALPIIDSISPKSASIGQVIKITGSNFGNSRGKSAVYFSRSYNSDGAKLDKDTEYGKAQEDAQYIEASSYDFDYEYWDDSQIRVKVPDGASGGKLFIQTNKGKTEPMQWTLDTSVGQKTYGASRTYVVQVAAELDNTSFQEMVEFTLHIPRVMLLPTQPIVQMTDVSPAPKEAEERTANGSTVIQRVSIPRNTSAKNRFSQVFACDIYEVNTKVALAKIPPYSTKSLSIYGLYTKPSKLVPSSDKRLTSLALKIAGKESNPYLEAKLVYDYLLDNFIIQGELRPIDSKPLDLLDFKAPVADSYDMAILYCALLRALKIPCVPLSGILVGLDMKARSHWWCEFYIENIGWIPVDLSLASGLYINSIYNDSASVDARSYYFGNMDCMHIAFSRDYPQKPISSTAIKSYGRKKTYAFLPIWEEVNSDKVHYSLLWSDPIIMGVY